MEGGGHLNSDGRSVFLFFFQWTRPPFAGTCWQRSFWTPPIIIIVGELSRPRSISFAPDSVRACVCVLAGVVVRRSSVEAARMVVAIGILRAA